MRVGVDGRSLAGDGRGVAVYASGMLAALEAAGVELRVHTPRNRLVHGAAAVVGRPRLERLLGPVDVVWLPAPAPVAVGRRTPYVLTLHDLTLLERPADFTPYERLWHRLARPGALVRRAARVVAASMDTAKRARVRFGVDVDVVPAGPGDPGPDPDPAAVAAVRERYGPYFLYVGALEPRKALDTLVAAHRGLAPALVLAGDGRLAAQLSGPGVHLTGRVERAEKAALYAGALAVVLPSWWEGYGYPPLEGFAHGTPAIVSDLPALHETAGDGACYVAPGDVDGLRAALEAVASDQELRRRLADGGAAALRERSWEKSAAALRTVLEEAAA
jgi:glycosyltransferase involved in cell wall biosynthesis